MIYICLNELRQILAKKMQPLADREYKQVFQLPCNRVIAELGVAHWFESALRAFGSVLKSERSSARALRSRTKNAIWNLQYLPEVFGSLREPYAKTPFLRFSQCHNLHPNGTIFCVYVLINSENVLKFFQNFILIGRVGENSMKKSLESREDLMQMRSLWLFFLNKQLGLRRRKRA
jgi:hypothetical protein